MAALTTQNIVAAGTAPTFGAAAGGGDTAQVGTGQDTFLVVKNGGGSSINVTITAPGTNSYGEPNPDPVVAVANGTEKWIPLRKEYDAGDGTGRAAIAYSGVTSVTVAVIRMG